MAFSFKASITIDETKVAGSADHTDFPVLVSGTYDGTGTEPDLRTTANGGNVENASGYDIQFFSDSDLTTRLAAERESFVATTGVVNFWVKVPTLDYDNDTVIYIAYGDSGISTDPNDDATYGATSTWNANYLGVWHLPDGTTLTALDSTSNNNDGTLTNTPTAAAGQIDGAADFESSSDQYINVGNGASLQITGDLTLSAWIKLESLPASNGVAYQVIAKDKDTGGRAYTFDVYNDNGTKQIRLY